MANKIYDCIIVGAGVAGMTASIYLGRANKTVALIDKNGFGGNIAKSPKVENIPGFTSISGIDFAANMYEQVCNLSTVEHIINEASLLDYDHGLIKVRLIDNTMVCGRTIIIATGTEHKKLNLPTKNQYTCVTCDGPFFSEKPVIVVGSGNTGAAYALELANYCKSVYLCDVTPKMCCEQTTAKKIKENKNIHWIPNCAIKSVITDGSESLTAVVLSNDRTIKVNAIFTAIGMIPKTDIFKQFVDIDNGYIVSDDCTTKKVPGVFVAGDCRTSKVKQVTTAASDGTVAAIEVIKYLSK